MRIPAKWNHFAEKDSRQINMLEQILVAKVFNFGGICSDKNVSDKKFPQEWRARNAMFSSSRAAIRA